MAYRTRVISGILCVTLLATGCTNAVEIPRDQFEAAAREDNAKYRIQMIDESYYTVRRFSLTDSTIVIEQLNPSDSRYQKVEEPITLSSRDVASISKLEVNEGRSLLLVAGILVVVMVNVYLSAAFSGLD